MRKKRLLLGASVLFFVLSPSLVFASEPVRETLRSCEVEAMSNCLRVGGCESYFVPEEIRQILPDKRIQSVIVYPNGCWDFFGKDRQRLEDLNGKCPNVDGSSIINRIKITEQFQGFNKDCIESRQKKRSSEPR